MTNPHDREAKDTMMLCCASCGTAEVDNIKLQKCTACKSVRYCGVECQRNHRPHHKKECKKIAAELRDEILFQQPESSHHGDCPICCLRLPLPLDESKFSMQSCCCKLICQGCDYANTLRERDAYESRKENTVNTCPFCRRRCPKSEEEIVLGIMKRVEANDPVAIMQMGARRVAEGDYVTAFEYWTKAAALGDAASHYQLSKMYHFGHSVVEKDRKKEMYHLEEASICGHPRARFSLGAKEWNDKRMARAVKHFIIAANLGDDDAIEMLKKGYASGVVSKEDFATALRAHHAAVDATKSPQREEGVAAFQQLLEARAARGLRR